MDHGQVEVPNYKISDPRLTSWMLAWVMKTNRIDKSHVSQQFLSATSVRTCASVSFAPLEVIHDFHEIRNPWFH